MLARQNDPVILKFLRLFVVALPLWFCLPAYSQEFTNPESERILLLHGVWSAQGWEWDFDIRFHELLEEVEGIEVEIHSSYLGIAQNPSTETVARQLANIEAILIEHDVDLIVAVLPPAIDFLSQLSLPPDLPLVLVLPDEQNSPEFTTARVATVPSAWRVAMEQTLQQIITLRPQTTTVEVMVGNGPGDLSYLERFRQVAASYQTELDFNYSIGIPRSQLIDSYAALPDTSVIFSLTFESSGVEYSREPPSSLQRLTDTASVPVFSIYDSVLQYGIAGGHLTSVLTYATQATEHSLALLRGSTITATESRASTIYNWDRVQEWNLPVSRLSGDVELLGRPDNLFQDYPAFSTITLNLIALLALGLGFMIYRYQQSQQARALVTEKERLVRESEERYRLVTDNVADIIWVWEEGEATLKFCSTAIQRVTGFSVAEVMQMPITDMMSEEDFKVIAHSFSEPAVPMLTRQIQLYHRDGHRVWVEIAVQVSRTLDNGKREWVGVSRDITQRKQNEIERKNLEDQMLQTQKFESLGTLAGGIAHDFNNILTVIIGITDMLKLELDGKGSSDKLLSRLQKAADKARMLVQQILTFSRQSRGDKSTCDLAALINSSISLLTSGKPDDVQLQIDIAKDDFRIDANSNQIQQVIINLASNALESVNNKTGVITLSAYTRSIESATNLTHGQLLPGDYVCLRVQDNGSGMSSRELDKAFDPFYTSKELGSGMGLAIVHGIVLDHGGAIDIQSGTGKGTVVEILLPAKTEPANNKPIASDSKMTKNSRPKRVIVVDDQAELLQVVADMLEQLGHHCITCADPKEAIEVIRQRSHELDLIITDYSMPEMNGVELMELCQQYCPDIPVIISTGYAEHSINLSQLSEDRRSRFGLLDKPYTLAQLREIVENTAQVRQ